MIVLVPQYTLNFIVMTSIKDQIQKSIEHLKHEFSGLQIGRASSALVENLSVDAYGAIQPLKAVASISIPDSKSVSIEPWDKSMLGAIEKAIQNSDLNMNPTNNGNSVILNIPPLTEERRRDLVKVVGRMAEDAKISIRNVRHDALSRLKREEHDGDITEDDRKRSEKQIQEQVDKANSEIAQLAKDKETQIMTV